LIGRRGFPGWYGRYKSSQQNFLRLKSMRNINRLGRSHAADGTQ